MDNFQRGRLRTYLRKVDCHVYSETVCGFSTDSQVQTSQGDDFKGRFQRSSDRRKSLCRDWHDWTLGFCYVLTQENEESGITAGRGVKWGVRKLEIVMQKFMICLPFYLVVVMVYVLLTH